MRCVNVKIIKYAVCMLLLSGGIMAQAAVESVQDASLNVDTDLYYTEGRAAFDDGLFALAQKKFELYLAAEKKKQTDTRFFEVASLLVESLHRQQKYDEIIKFADSVAGKWKKYGRSDEILYWKAAAYCGADEYGKADKTIRKFNKKYEKSKYAGKILRVQAWCAIKSGDKDDAVKYFSKFSKKYAADSDNELNLLEWGKLLLDMNKPEKARIPLLKLTQSPATNSVVNYGSYFLAKSYIQDGKWKEAEKVLTGMTNNIALNKGLLTHIWYDLAIVQDELGRNYDAAISLQKAIDTAVNPEDKYKEHLRLGFLYLKNSEFEKGVPLLKSIIANNINHPESEKMQLILASTLMNAGKYEEATKEYQNYLETYTNKQGDAEAYFGKGMGLLKLNRNAEAADAFTKAYGLFTNKLDKAKCLYKSGDAYFANEQFMLASKAYERLLKEYPEINFRAEILFQLGECNIQLNKPEKAEKYFREIADKYEGDAIAEEALLKIASAKSKRQEWNSAIAVFDELMHKYPKGAFFVNALYGKAMAEYRMFRFKDALAALNSIVTDFPDSSFVEQSYYQRGMCYYWMGQDKKAEEICISFLKKYPQSPFVPDVLFWLGKFYFNYGDFAKAESRLLEYADKYSKLPLADDALYWAGIAASKNKEYVKAIDIFSRLLKDYPDSDKKALSRFAQANALSMIDKSSAAILLYDEIINKYPDSGLVQAAWGRKGDCQFTLGSDDPERYNESIESYKVVANDAESDLDLVMQAEYKIGRSLEKSGKTDEAFEQYYDKVILRYFEDEKKGIHHNEACKMWFSLAAFNAVDILVAKNDYRRAVTILNRVIGADVGYDRVAGERIKKIKSEHWWLFY